MAGRLILVLCFLGAVVAGAAQVWMMAAREGLARLEERAEADLRLASDRLVSALLQFREIAVLAAAHPDVAALARGDAGVAPEAVAAVLRRIADQAGARDILLLSPEGRVLAGEAVPLDRWPLTPDLRRAARGASGRHHLVDPATGERMFTFAAPVFRENGPVAGIVLLRIEAEQVEAPGRGDPVPVWFTDTAGVAFVANRSEMVFETEARPVSLEGVYPPGTPLHAPARRTRMVAGTPLQEGGAYLPALALPVSQPLPVISMTGHALADATGVMRSARAQALSVALAALAVGAVFLALWERRRALAARLAAEARANAALEQRVAERTAELSATNARLRQTQAELVQAGKLSALGQMSAGISHELNQPLMAIGSYAENAELLLERGRGAEVGENLARISDLARRMGRIIKNLRAFARQEAEPATRVGLAAVVEAALDISQMRLARAGVSVDWQRPDFPAIVMGGEVRLSQVVVNLLANAADAMADSATRQITIRIARGDRPDRIVLSLRDTGPGIAEPEKIFDPFYSTKEVGTGEGMGLGLSISYGLVQSFGGTLRGENVSEGGALFTVNLQAAPEIARGGPKEEAQ